MPPFCVTAGESTGTCASVEIGYVARESGEVAGPTWKATPSSVIRRLAIDCASTESLLQSCEMTSIVYFLSSRSLYCLMAS